MTNHAMFLGLAGSVFLLDRLTKLLVVATIAPSERVPVIEGVFALTSLRNPGAAFGLFANLPAWFRLTFLVATTVVAIGLVVLIHLRSVRQSLAFRVALALILGGALGNLYERLTLGAVIDYLDFFIGSYHWPAFNLADAAITSGVGLLILDSFRRSPTPKGPTP